MDIVRLYMLLFATGYVLSICMALECNWKRQYEYKGKCCQICPLGTFPIQHCTNSSESVCKNCTNMNDHCFCNNNLCEDDTCSKCSPTKKCTPGEKLIRTGLFKFRYICEPCPSQTYNDEERNICKPTME
ncbi:hypothetical protein HF521_000431 [Silurus meridionalis]|uniref:TNFR-Cys domain-containing protein n=1 Tax=Silurus meridionalis TaxID=175797 RepID=A0A8T0C014_SILME|nr:hypothetical protein HF521_000431 [Silurus meridionalis]